MWVVTNYYVFMSNIIFPGKYFGYNTYVCYILLSYNIFYNTYSNFVSKLSESLFK